MTAQLEAPRATTTVLMTELEARVCIQRIKTGLENIRVAALALYEGEGWRALGYKTFRECAKAEFGKSEAYIYRLVDAARADRAISPIGENLVPVPESHVREMAPINGDEEKVRAVYSRALETSNGKPTAAIVHDEVDRELGIERSTSPSLSRTARAVTRQVVTGQLAAPPVEPEDESQDTGDDDATFGYGDSPDSEPSVVGNLIPDPYDTNDPFDLMVPHPDGVSPPVPADPETRDPILTGETAPTSDQPGATERDAAESEHPAATSPAPPAVARSYDPSQRASGISLGTRTAPSRRVTTAHQPILVDGKAPEPVYPTADGFINGVESHLVGAELDDFARQFGAYYRRVQQQRQMHGGAVAPQPTTELRTMLATRPAVEIVDALTDGASVPRLTELVGLLAERLARARMQFKAEQGAA